MKAEREEGKGNTPVHLVKYLRVSIRNHGEATGHTVQQLTLTSLFSHTCYSLRTTSTPTTITDMSDKQKQEDAHKTLYDAGMVNVCPTDNRLRRAVNAF